MIAQISKLSRQHPRFGGKVILLGEFLVHLHQIFGQQVFLGDALDARVHINFLVGMQLLEEIDCYRCVVQRQVIRRINFIPMVVGLADWALIILRVILQLPVALFARNLLDDGVARLLNVYNEPLDLLFLDELLELFLV